MSILSGDPLLAAGDIRYSPLLLFNITNRMHYKKPLQLVLI